ncbi:MAG TPA: heparan-alpha-glucosaminide N-acetyltransferase domain-containing protein [Polyangiales bacterium]|nr:heparan-alpha-glucosaminide N-acetyltransferase domain-containing protein [Polyangiales bacterium]
MRVLDLLRLLAALQMVQGHTIDAVLALDARHGAIHTSWVWLRGLTSVAFLFATGVAFHLMALHERAPREHDRAGVRRRLRRAGSLILLGYLLHAPLAVLWGQPAASVWREAVMVDVLQCIGVSLVLLELLAIGLRTGRAVRATSLLLAGICLLAAPWLADLHAANAWRPLLNYITPQAGSIFPLFPWAAHVFSGVALAPWLLAPQRRALRWLLAGLGLVLLGQLASLAGADSAALQLPRLGWVLVLGSALERLEPATRAWPAWAWRLPSETLFVYAFHVVLVYGQGIGLAALIGPRLSPGQAVLAAALVIALSFGAALGYRRVLPTLAVRTAPG